MATYRKQKSGKWTVEVCVRGVRKSRTFPTKTEGKLWSQKAEYELGRDATGESGTHTLGDVFSRYAEQVSESKKGAHWEIIRLKKLGLDPIAAVKLADLKRENLQDWISRRMVDVKPSSVNRELNLISHCLTQARRWRLMSHKPMEDLQRPKNPPHRERRITQDEIDTILITLNYTPDCSLKEKRQQIAAAFLFAIETGMRAGEICGIKREHIRGRTVHLPETKNGAPRDVPLSSAAAEILDRLGDDVFDLEPRSLSTIFRRAVKSANIDGLTFHDTRHEAITRLASKLDVLDLARMVGHRDIKMLLIYYNKKADELATLLD